MEYILNLIQGIDTDCNKFIEQNIRYCIDNVIYIYK